MEFMDENLHISSAGVAAPIAKKSLFGADIERVRRRKVHGEIFLKNSHKLTKKYQNCNDKDAGIFVQYKTFSGGLQLTRRCQSFPSSGGCLAMRYYDQVENRWRIKRRYVWAFWSALGTLPLGMILGAQLFH